MRLLAPAKVNLHLRVGPPRADGFHPLLTWMCTVGLFDRLTIEARSPGAATDARANVGRDSGPDGPAAPEGSTRSAPWRGAAGEAGAVTMTCDLPGLPCDADNLVVRVALAWQADLRQGVGRGVGSGGAVGAARATGEQFGRVERLGVTLGKEIPVGAGLGGGSSDAARALLALDRLSGTGRAADELSAFAARFGSDLSFFIYGGSAVCRGRGEQVVPIPRPAARWAVLILPRVSMPTPAVYRKFDEMNLGRAESLAVEPDWAAWSKLGAKHLLPLLVNDLEPAAFAIEPSLGRLRAGAEALLGRPVRMSGSGSSLFTLYDEEDEAKRAVEAVAAGIYEHVRVAEVAPNFADDLNGSAA